MDWNWPILPEKYLKIDWSVKMPCIDLLAELQAPSSGLLLKANITGLAEESIEKKKENHIPVPQ